MATTGLFEIVNFGSFSASKSGKPTDPATMDVPDVVVGLPTIDKAVPIVKLTMENRRISFPIGLETLWAAITNIGHVAACFPQATIKCYDEKSVTGTARVDFGLITLTYSGTVTVVKRNDPKHTVLFEVQARDDAGHSTVTFRVNGTLLSSSPGATHLGLTAHSVVIGSVARFDSDVLFAVVHLALNSFLCNLGMKLTETTPFWGQTGKTTTNGIGDVRTATRARQRKLADIFDVTASLFDLESGATASLHTNGMAIIRHVDDTLLRLGANGQLTEKIEEEFLHLGQLALTALQNVSSDVRSRFGSFVNTYYPPLRRRKTLPQWLATARTPYR